MKKFMTTLMALVMSLSMVACGGNISDTDFEALKSDYNDMVSYYEDSIAYLNQYPEIMTELGIADDINSMADSVNEVAGVLNEATELTKDDAAEVQTIIDTVYESLETLNNAVEEAVG